MKTNHIYTGDALQVTRTLPDASVQCVVTSPPYFLLRDYGVDGHLGLEQTPQEFVAALVAIFAEVHRVLRDDGVLWVNLGDTYTGGGRGVAVTERQRTNKGANTDKRLKLKELPDKSRLFIPHRFAIAMQDAGWIARDEIVWHKRAPMPESVKDRTTKAHEFIFMFSKSNKPTLWTHRDRPYSQCVYQKPAPDYVYVDRITGEETRVEPQDMSRYKRVNLWRSSDYYYDAAAVAEPAKHAGEQIILGEKSFSKGQAKGLGIDPSGNGAKDAYTVAGTRNLRSVWALSHDPFAGAHFATFPREIPRRCILASTKPGDVVLDPFMGAGTTALVARQLGRQYVGIELNPEYVGIAEQRLADPSYAQIDLFASQGVAA